MTLIDWKRRPRLILREVQLILAADGKVSATEYECRAWAREFIRRYLPSWQPGDPLDQESARLIGSSFERQVSKARRYMKRQS